MLEHRDEQTGPLHITREECQYHVLKRSLTFKQVRQVFQDPTVGQNQDATTSADFKTVLCTRQELPNPRPELALRSLDAGLSREENNSFKNNKYEIE
ncbi:hypothetical protein Cadr_000027063 [Camelus dromedarius]|uniref:Uncharacterized protein n=1 Tax=Camelus dromedarius TaxID=9838 RepID=A0A5N4C5C6_CAMDR|nr:hypothetical protein Cadr_000027063 [Camelus dromedarius]